MDNLTIRPMIAEDWPAVSEIYRLGIETNLATFERAVPAYAVWDQGHCASCRFVATEDDRIVGWAALSAVSAREVYRGVAELSIYLHPSCKGRGIGKALLSHLIAASEAAGFWTLQATILAENTASIGLHAACSFREVGRRERIARDHLGVWRDTVLMERRSPILY